METFVEGFKSTKVALKSLQIHLVSTLHWALRTRRFKCMKLALDENCTNLTLNLNKLDSLLFQTIQSLWSSWMQHAIIWRGTRSTISWAIYQRGHSLKWKTTQTFGMHIPLTLIQSLSMQEWSSKSNKDSSKWIPIRSLFNAYMIIHQFIVLHPRINFLRNPLLIWLSNPCNNNHIHSSNTNSKMRCSCHLKINSSNK